MDSDRRTSPSHQTSPSPSPNLLFLSFDKFKRYNMTMTTSAKEDENSTNHDQNNKQEIVVDDVDEEEEEVIWRDDRVRWAEDFENEEVTGTRNRKKKNTNQDEEEEEEETAFMDPFKDPDPFHSFEFYFQYSSLAPTYHGSEDSNDDDDDDENKVIHISLRGYKKDADQVWQSTGVTLWRASEYLCQYLLRRQIQSDTDRTLSSSFLKGKRILELGAGLGLCGLLAHRLAGPDSEVCITDGDIDALALIRENIDRNKSSKQKPSSSFGQVVARQLIWGHDSTETFMKKYCVGEGGECEVKPFDILIASDIVYALVIVEPLWETIRLLLRRRRRRKRRRSDAGVGDLGESSCSNDENDKSGNNDDDSVNCRPFFLMAYAKREVPVTIEMVLDSATKAGFSYELVDEDPEGIWIYNFWWSSDDDDEDDNNDHDHDHGQKSS